MTNPKNRKHLFRWSLTWFRKSCFNSCQCEAGYYLAKILKRLKVSTLNKAIPWRSDDSISYVRFPSDLYLPQSFYFILVTGSSWERTRKDGYHAGCVQKWSFPIYLRSPKTLKSSYHKLYIIFASASNSMFYARSMILFNRYSNIEKARIWKRTSVLWADRVIFSCN